MIDASAQAAYLAIYRSEYERLRSYLRQRATPDTADDLTQEAWTRLWQHWDEVGAEHAAAWTWRFGRHPEPDAIRDAVYGDGHTGYTEPGPMAAYLRAVWGLDAQARQTADPLPVIEHALRGRAPVLARTWEGTYYHWTPVTGLSEAAVVRHQTLGGYRETLALAEWQRRYAGWLVVLG